MKKLERDIIIVPADFKFKAKVIFHKLDQELLKLQKIGKKPKRMRLTLALVKKVIYKCGLDEVEKMDWETFEQFCEKLGFKI